MKPASIPQVLHVVAGKCHQNSNEKDRNVTLKGLSYEIYFENVDEN
jgi:hypothetical protein